MSDHPPQSKVSEADYTTIEAAITFSQRGRQFLAEYARRQRGGEMDRLIDSVGRIELLSHRNYRIRRIAQYASTISCRCHPIHGLARGRQQELLVSTQLHRKPSNEQPDISG